MNFKRNALNFFLHHCWITNQTASTKSFIGSHKTDTTWISLIEVLFYLKRLMNNSVCKFLRFLELATSTPQQNLCVSFHRNTSVQTIEEKEIRKVYRKKGLWWGLQSSITCVLLKLLFCIMFLLVCWVLCY